MRTRKRATIALSRVANLRRRCGATASSAGRAADQSDPRLAAAVASGGHRFAGLPGGHVGPAFGHIGALPAHAELAVADPPAARGDLVGDRKSTRLNSR